MLAKVPPTYDAQTYFPCTYPTMAASWQLPSAIRLSTYDCQDMFVRFCLRWRYNEGSGDKGRRLFFFFDDCFDGPPAAESPPRVSSVPAFLLVWWWREAAVIGQAHGCWPHQITPPGSFFGHIHRCIHAADGYTNSDTAEFHHNPNHQNVFLSTQCHSSVFWWE